MKKLNKKEVAHYAYSLMSVCGSSECLMEWSFYNENRKYMDELFHIEFSHGDNEDSIVRVMDKEEVV
jgi:hypothetical protein